MLNVYENEFNSWIDKEKKAIELINIVGKLWFDRSIELLLFRKPLFDIGSSEILAHHQYARTIVNKNISIYETLAIAQAIAKSNLAPSRIDIGRLAAEWIDADGKFSSIEDFVIKNLVHHIGKDKIKMQSRDVVLYGFGRIGRIAARELVMQAGKGEQLRLRAIVTRSYSDEDLIKRADLLRNDSVHGPFLGTITEDFEKKALVINGQLIFMIAAKDPSEVDYTNYGISNALLIDNTGVLRDREGLGKHLASKGIERVLLTAPGKGDVPNIVFGVNQNDFNKEETIFSAASCTTNAIVPVLKIIQDAFGIEKGHIETVHSYTNDQNLLDNYHKKYRRGRSAALNMVITETGADKAVAKVFPVLEGKLTGNAVRVPTPDVSLAILNLTLNTEVSKADIEKVLKEASLFGDMVEQLEYSISNELVSSDVIGNSHASIVDGPATILSKDGRSAVIYVWYDNEYGYTRQVVRLAKSLAGVIRLTYY
ncbi:MAG: glyceraldehyde-3-phosphate dehydrogenase [Sphingobacteriales bacterium 17-39-43]|uniref:glyceraldehyde-3-phosphate dehydrogenase n=1 Tax=Daejeonella sp. TaxID=2805397 RepID=UPI000BC4EF42|nr:glyceraldehyde-3-phosphate dehydrogenase [Daejeonella sp.]OYZ28029.1 MAG: glyceraldehyde-3-phosphate dehydrogenase [Sphingobacteriales bacterium 16-39-50]OZA21996.1 MAG: glyceraldehyde-3-phosphate dehydrogenase [Sphingobacteriales bacterium 17-39-43]HQT24754.1 glyceraldehyde-3-phosphate dehydrogenase [Daejeonella sp.]HQT58702.1 glyceraldehyde-3-phosphate dehydrogenase [Daejeonella sp.]